MKNTPSPYRVTQIHICQKSVDVAFLVVITHQENIELVFSIQTCPQNSKERLFLLTDIWFLSYILGRQAVRMDCKSVIY